MQTFTLDQLSERAQDAAVERYAAEIANFAPFGIVLEQDAKMFAMGYFVGALVRFNIHGERIA